MGHTSVLRIIFELFEVSLNNVFREVEQMSKYIFSISGDYIKLSGLYELESLSNGFLRYGNINGPTLVIDDTHIPIHGPKVNGANDYNRIKFDSLNVLALVEYD